MTRTDFEVLRDLPDKTIRQDIRLTRRQGTLPALVVEGIRIENSQGVDLRMNISYNPEVGSKTINVIVPGSGPICRLDVDGPAHRPVGRCHKHSLQNERCPDRNLADSVADRTDLEGRSLREVFDDFCRRAAITHVGIFFAPDEPDGGAQP